jgi:hypothetical protein
MMLLATGKSLEAGSAGVRNAEMNSPESSILNDRSTASGD